MLYSSDIIKIYTDKLPVYTERNILKIKVGILDDCNWGEN